MSLAHGRSIHRLLIANRGEIALRIIRTCRGLGIQPLLAASEADCDSVAARSADEVLVIGPPPSNRSYLNIDAVLAAAARAGADAVHPGYGFLSENPALAQACEAAGLAFVGPTERQLRAVGDKLLARENAVAAGLPVVPGGAAAGVDEAARLAAELGFPVLIKAVGGGGGRGMKVVRDGAGLKDTLDLAMAEAESAFGDSRVYLERFVASGRHVEVQLLGDGRELIHLGTRDCSIQRRYQKLLEEAPAPFLPRDLRDAIEGAAVDFGRHLDWRGAGTVEFLVGMERMEFYFLEMNARIQVEHPVTEAVTGVDLVHEQIRIAEGRPLRLRQQDVVMNGHALECRINAEDCRHDFRPSPGRVRRARFPAGEGIRVDSAIESGSEVPPFYDSLLAKLIVHGRDRGEALQRLQRALSVCLVEGVETNLALHRAIVQDRAFRRGGVDTAFLPAFLESADWLSSAPSCRSEPRSRTLHSGDPHG